MKALPDWKKAMLFKFRLGMLYLSALLSFMIGGVTGLYWPKQEIKEWTGPVFYQAVFGALSWILGLLFLIVMHL